MAVFFRARHIAVAVMLCSIPAHCGGFLKHDPFANRYLAGTDVGFQEAVASVMGCGPAGADNVHARLAAVDRDLAPMWRALPKDGNGQVEWRSMRYLAHKYFLKKSSLLIRGFEPTRQVNESHVGHADILTKHAPSLVETVLDGKRSARSYSMADASVLVAAIDRLIFNDESVLLEASYKYVGKSPGQLVSRIELLSILHVYAVKWLFHGSDQIDALLQDPSRLDEALSYWPLVNEFMNGAAKSYLHFRQQAPKVGHGRLIMTRRYSFDDAHEIVGSVTQTFASYWESQCQQIKMGLVAMDKSRTGRVSLPNFYGALVDGETRFAESTEYLRDLGALDESSRRKGPQVIIPNYVQGASNCIVASENYFVCCQNECEVVLDEIEDNVGGPYAKPESIVEIVMGLSGLDDAMPRLTAELSTQLGRIAHTHGGKVPIHGRLFAQWLHYVFPQECPFPHKVGTRSFVDTQQYGTQAFASKTAVHSQANQRSSTGWQMQAVDEERWMSQWSEDEELLAVDVLHLRSPWEARHTNAIFILGLVVVLVGSGVFAQSGKLSGAFGVKSVGFEHKVHLV